jgi:hypothetical protein
MRQRRPLPQPSQEYIPFKGGLDLLTPSWQTKPGVLRESQNFEVGIFDGYDSIIGYERFDGRSKPSDAPYAILNANITGTFAVGSVVTGSSSAATATVLATGSYNDQSYLALTMITGTFVDGENLTVSAIIQGTASGTQIIDGASTAQLAALYKHLAADVYRSLISAPTGSGSLLGAWMLDDVKYVFRNNAGNTEALLWKSTSAGWVQVSLGFELEFTSGSVAVNEGDTITGSVSGATAVVTRVVIESGSIGSGDASGRFIFSSQTGTFASENIDVGASSNVATISGNSSAITMLPNGRFEMITSQFNGVDDRIYGCDGENRGFEFDGTVFVPINTGMAADTPTHVVAFRNHLFFAFGGSAQHSAIGNPYSWSSVLGAGELALGEAITGFEEQPGDSTVGTLAIFGRNSTHMLYGTSSADWNLVKYRDEIGAYAYSIQQVTGTILLDDRGISVLRTAQEFGNFLHSSISERIQPFLVERRRRVADSCIARDKNQYRLFFTDGYGLYVTMDGRKVMGIMPVLFPNPVTCMFSLENSTGEEEIFFGSTDGNLYQLDKGTSFDGENMECFFTTHFMHFNSPRVLKRYIDAIFEIQGEGYSEFSFTFEVQYGASDRAQPGSQSVSIDLSSARWDAFTWDAFFWDGKTIKPSRARLSGTGVNISMTVRRNSNYFAQAKFSGAFLQHLPRRIERSS